MKKPNKLKLANLPTPIEYLSRLSSELDGPVIYIKRDDQTGTELSGNKIRKLEYAIQEAIEQGCDTLITCGGIQTNHGRSTAAAAAKLGLRCELVLGADPLPVPQGNYLLNTLFGAKIHAMTPEAFAVDRMTKMEEIQKDLVLEGRKGYMIPLGASNGIGTFGYYDCMLEIAAQEEKLGFEFDHIVMAVGSGATYAGLFYCNKVLNRKTQITGIPISSDGATFKKTVDAILQECFTYTESPIDYSEEDIKMIDGYVGLGYALSQPEELQFISKLAAQEGVVLDPVYTGKAMAGLVNEIKTGRYKKGERILFIHTGGLYGAFSKYLEFAELK